MLSAFSFREFRGINRRAGGVYVRMCACVCRVCIRVSRLDCTRRVAADFLPLFLLLPFSLSVSPRYGGEVDGSRIFGTRAINAPHFCAAAAAAVVFAVVRKTEFQPTARKPPRAVVLIVDSEQGDRYDSDSQEVSAWRTRSSPSSSTLLGCLFVR